MSGEEPLPSVPGQVPAKEVTTVHIPGAEEAKKAEPIQTDSFGAAITKSDDEGRTKENLLKLLGVKGKKKSTLEKIREKKVARKQELELERIRDEELTKSTGISGEGSYSRSKGIKLAEAFFSKKELERINELYGDDPPELEEFYNTIVNEVDTDDDGKITLAELVHFRKSKVESGNTEALEDPMMLILNAQFSLAHRRHFVKASRYKRKNIFFCRSLLYMLLTMGLWSILAYYADNGTLTPRATSITVVYETFDIECDPDLKVSRRSPDGYDAWTDAMKGFPRIVYTWNGTSVEWYQQPLFAVMEQGIFRSFSLNLLAVNTLVVQLKGTCTTNNNLPAVASMLTYESRPQSRSYKPVAEVYERVLIGKFDDGTPKHKLTLHKCDMKEIRAIKCKDSAVESLISGEFSGFVYVGIFSLSLLVLLAVQGAYFIAYRGWKDDVEWWGSIYYPRQTVTGRYHKYKLMACSGWFLCDVAAGGPAVAATKYGIAFESSVMHAALALIPPLSWQVLGIFISQCSQKEAVNIDRGLCSTGSYYAVSGLTDVLQKWLPLAYIVIVSIDRYMYIFQVKWEVRVWYWPISFAWAILGYAVVIIYAAATGLALLVAVIYDVDRALTAVVALVTIIVYLITMYTTLMWMQREITSTLGDKKSKYVKELREAGLSTREIWLVMLTGTTALLMVILWVIIANNLLNDGNTGVGSLFAPFAAVYVRYTQLNKIKKKQQDAINKKTGANDVKQVVSVAKKTL